MPTNYLKEISALNKIDLSKVEGYRLYYSVYKNIISLIFNIGFVTCAVSLIIFIDNNAATILGFLAGAYFTLER